MLAVGSRRAADVRGCEWRGIANSATQRGGLSHPISAQAFTCRLMSSGFSRAELPSSTGYVRGSARHATCLRFTSLTGGIGGPTPSEWGSQPQRRGENGRATGPIETGLRTHWPRAAQLAMIGHHAGPCRFAADHGDNRLRQPGQMVQPGGIDDLESLAILLRHHEDVLPEWESIPATEAPPRPMGTIFIQKAGLHHGTTIRPLQSLVFDPR